MRSPCAAVRNSPCSWQLKKNCAQQDPEQSKRRKENIHFKKIKNKSSVAKRVYMAYLAFVSGHLAWMALLGQQDWGLKSGWWYLGTGFFCLLTFLGLPRCCQDRFFCTHVWFLDWDMLTEKRKAQPKSWEVSIISDMQMTPPLWQKVKN